MQDADGPVPLIWASNGGYAACIDPNKGRVLATLWHDGAGTYHPTLFMPLAMACRCRSLRTGVKSRLGAFPRIALELPGMTEKTMHRAQSVIEDILDAASAF